MLSKIDIRDFFEINQGLYSELRPAARRDAMMRIVVEALNLAPNDAAQVSGRAAMHESPQNARVGELRCRTT